MVSMKDLKTLEKAEEMIADLRFEDAASLLEPLRVSTPLARPMLLNALGKLEDYPRIVSCFDSPESPAEVIALMDAMFESGMHAELKEKLDCLPFGDDPSVAQLKKRLHARLAR